MRKIRVEIDYAALTGDKFNLVRNLAPAKHQQKGHRESWTAALSRTRGT
jgi:hypothetical protein